MYISDEVKTLLKYCSDDINSGEFKDIFVEANLRDFTAANMLEIHNILLTANIVDSSEIRNELLYEDIVTSLKIAKFHQDHPAMKDRYLAQFIRGYLKSCYGFTEKEVMQVMFDNEDNLDVSLEPYLAPGQSSVNNYILIFD